MPTRSKPKSVEYFSTPNGRKPFRTWFATLPDKRTQAKIQVRIERVGLGYPGHCSSVGGGVMELKIDYGPGYRVYFGTVGNDLLLLCGGDKRTQASDIIMARKRWAEFRRRGG